MEYRVSSLRVVAGLLLLAAAAACGLVKPPSEGTPLAIQRFIAVPAEVPAGATTMLSWDVEGAESVEVDNGIGLVQATGSRSVKPTVTTTYRLVAVAGTSLATASIRVVVAPGSPSPTPSATPTPVPSPTPTTPPTPAPSPSPSPRD